MDTSSPSVFFCHQCSQELDQVTAEYTCPRCQSGFIEELQEPLGRARGGQHGAALDFGEEEDEDDPQHMGDEGGYIAGDQLLEQILGPMLFGVARGDGGGGVPAAMGGRVNVGPARGGGGGGPRLGVGAGPMAGPLMLQELLANLTGQPVGGGEAAGVGGGMHSFFVPGGGAGMQMYGNPGDYAWGRGGIDAVVTQLLNQFDGAGPAPLKTEYIKEIPLVEITTDHINSKMQCSVCWEDFQLGESVRRLHCDHFFHDPCIVPWLELHSTCPVCRKSQDPEGDSGVEQGPSGDSSGPQESVRVAATAHASTEASPMGNAMTYVFNLLGYNGETGGASSLSAPSTSSSSSSSSQSGRASSRPTTSSSATSEESTSRSRRDRDGRGGDSYEDYELE